VSVCKKRQTHLTRTRSSILGLVARLRCAVMLNQTRAPLNPDPPAEDMRVASMTAKWTSTKPQRGRMLARLAVFLVNATPASSLKYMS
jgi:hypothetical protein